MKYGQTSMLSLISVINIRDKDFVYQESYLPISMTNLITTQVVINPMSLKDDNVQYSQVSINAHNYPVTNSPPNIILVRLFLAIH